MTLADEEAFILWQETLEFQIFNSHNNDYNHGHSQAITFVNTTVVYPAGGSCSEKIKV